MLLKDFVEQTHKQALAGMDGRPCSISIDVAIRPAQDDDVMINHTPTATSSRVRVWSDYPGGKESDGKNLS